MLKLNGIACDLAAAQKTFVRNHKFMSGFGHVAFQRAACLLRGLRAETEHPIDPELVGEHAEPAAPECVVQW